jgi:hypothetical protein
MTSAELKTKREQYWRSLAGNGLSEQSLLAFVQEMGFALFGRQDHVQLPAIEMLAPARDASRSPGWARGLLEAQLAALKLVELELWPGRRVYTHVELLPFFYASVGDRQPDRDYLAQQKAGRLTPLAVDVYRLLMRHPGPHSRAELLETIGAQRSSAVAIEHAIAELALTLKVVRVGIRETEPLWQALVRALPQVREEATGISRIHAAGALISKFLGMMLLATEEEIARFFLPVFPSSRTHSALLGLSAGREIAFESLDGQPAYRLSLATLPV